MICTRLQLRRWLTHAAGAAAAELALRLAVACWWLGKRALAAALGFLW